MNMSIWDRENKEVVNNKELAAYAGIHISNFEDIGVQSDGTPVVFDKSGNFLYLDPQKFKVVFTVSSN